MSWGASGGAHPGGRVQGRSPAGAASDNSKIFKKFLEFLGMTGGSAESIKGRSPASAAADNFKKFL